jgi:GNAT superfamily N-acetyltransferase
MVFRQATSADIPGMQIVRHAVRENRLSDPSLVPDRDVDDYINRRGRGWVCDLNKIIIAFAIADLQDNSVWALFVDPAYEKKGIGKKLQQLMLDWYFSKTDHTIWLGTAPGTRAEIFYHKTGWKQNGMHGEKEMKFEMTALNWKSIHNLG